MPSSKIKAFNEAELTIEGVMGWDNNDVLTWALSTRTCLSRVMFTCLREQAIDGEVLLELTEDDVRDMRHRFNYMMPLGELKKFWLAVQRLQRRFKPIPSATESAKQNNTDAGQDSFSMRPPKPAAPKSFMCASAACRYISYEEELLDCCAERVPRELAKTIISVVYSFLVTWITSFTMVIVHERVPDMDRYPPLPDIFLDNIPRIPWAFAMSEIVGTLMFFMWAIVCIFHKHRLVLLRRFFALAGTVFLLRCVTMLITSLSVPGVHLKCEKTAYFDGGFGQWQQFRERIRRAYYIWSGLGMSIQGVRTCGDYMFSGHTCALTLLNFFITEYTPRNMFQLHTFTWILNVFGIFFILAAHEHYSIDVFVAFYITSRLFLYYHTLANNHAQVALDSTRTRIWFPMFYYFEKSVDGVVPNEYETLSSLADNIAKMFLLIPNAVARLYIFCRHFLLKLLDSDSRNEDAAMFDAES